MTLLSRLYAAQPRTKVAVGGLVALLLLVALFDWNWFRPALQNHLSQRSQRAVRIADLHVRLNARLQPVVRLRGVHIQNAPWAGTQPFVVAGEAEFTFEWLSLFQRVKLVSHLRLVDADIHLARQADGLRNWRLTRPDDRGPPRLQVMRLEPVRSKLHVVHQGVGLTLQTTSSPLAQADGEFTQRMVFSGSFHDGRFAGEALTGPVLSLQRTGELFALRGEARSADTRLRADGRMADLIRFGGLDAQLHLSGPSLAQVRPFFPEQAWPATPP
ncbi:MAG: AsmA family protein, partial [Rhizobacter sp.]|nr:AsmA family protein [Rhizobacter sp.]